MDVLPHGTERRLGTPLVMLVGFAVALVGVGSPAAAQTDYYNTDRGRPLTIEDAYPVERRAFELQLAPVRVERIDGGSYVWTFEPEIAYGVLPRTQLEVGVPIVFRDRANGAGDGAWGGGGIDISVLHNLNTETALPAFAVAADVLVPAGGFGPEDPFASATAIATKTFRFARFHVNGQYTFGPDAEEVDFARTEEVSRWLAGLAVDRAFPLRALLLMGEVVASQPIRDDEEVSWEVAAGLRYQHSPRLALDAGIGRQLTGDHRATWLNVGVAYAFGLPWHP